MVIDQEEVTLTSGLWQNLSLAESLHLLSATIQVGDSSVCGPRSVTRTRLGCIPSIYLLILL